MNFVWTLSLHLLRHDFDQSDFKRSAVFLKMTKSFSLLSFIRPMLLWCSQCSAVCLSLSLSALPLTSSLVLWKWKQIVLVFHVNYSLSYNKTYVARYGFILEVTAGKLGTCVPHGPRLNHKVSEVTRPPDARHEWPTGVWICPCVCNPSPQLWANSRLDESRKPWIGNSSRRENSSRKKPLLQKSIQEFNI